MLNDETLELATGGPCLDALRGAIDKARCGGLTAEGLRGYAASAVRMEQAILAELEALPAETLLALGDDLRNDPETGKEILAASAFDALLGALCLGNFPLWSNEPLKDRVDAALSRLTDEDVKAAAWKHLDDAAKAAALSSTTSLAGIIAHADKYGRGALTDESIKVMDDHFSATTRHLRRRYEKTVCRIGGDDTVTLSSVEMEGVLGYMVTFNVAMTREEWKDIKWIGRSRRGETVRHRKGLWFAAAADRSEFLRDMIGRVPEDTGLTASERASRAKTLRGRALKRREKAAQALGTDRLANTPRRARMAADATRSASREVYLCDIALRIADAGESGALKYLDGVRSMKDIEHLYSVARSAIWNLDAMGRDENCTEIDERVIRFCKFPAAMITHNDAEDMAEACEQQDFPNMAAKLREWSKGKHEWVSVDGERFHLVQHVLKRVRLDPRTKDAVKDRLERVSLMHRLWIHSDSEVRCALREMAALGCKPSLSEDPKARALRAIVGQKYHGFFPTPAALADELVSRLRGETWRRVLEPSAGTGRIVEALKRGQFKHVDAIEPSQDLREVLVHTDCEIVGRDVFDHTGEEYGAIVMNPPFYGEEIDHIQHCFDNLLAKDGVLVAVAPASVLENSTSKYKEFREWILEKDGTIERLPGSPFESDPQGHSTSVSVVIIEIWKVN